MSILSCQVEIPEIKTALGEAGPELTVGRKFLLQCDGDWPELNSEKIELRLEDADKYKLSLLEFQKSSKTHGQFLVVSYKAGEHHLKTVQVVDAEQSVVLGDLSFTVKSVINPQEPETEPFGPMGPITFGLPWWYFAISILLVVTIATWIWLKVRVRSQKKKLIEEMKISESALAPMPQLSQKLRQIIRLLDESTANSLVDSLDEAFRVYFARKFQVPTMIWSKTLILKDFKSNFRSVYEECGTYVAKTFIELERAKSSKEVIQLKDLEQLVALVRRTSEMLEKEIALNSKSGRAAGSASVGFWQGMFK